MVDYRASLQLSRKHSLHCMLCRAQASQQPRSLCEHRSSSAVLPFGTGDCPKDGQHSEMYLDCFIAVVFFIFEIVLFNILNKILIDI